MPVTANETTPLTVEEAMRRADELAAKNTRGGPFGSVILDAQGRVLGEGRNEVVHTNNPTCHAEMQALRDAGKRLGHWNLEGATLVTSCECCPMCLAGAYAAGVSQIVYANTRKHAAEIGFADDAIYEEMNVGFDNLRVERAESSPFLGNRVDAVVIDAEGKVLASVEESEEDETDPTGLASVLAVGKACTALGSFHLPDGCSLITRYTVHPLGFTAARWAHVEHIICLKTGQWEGEKRGHHPEAVYADIALAMEEVEKRRIPMTRAEDTATLEQTLATFTRWFADTNKVLY